MFTVALLGAIALALRGTSPAIALVTIGVVIALVGVFHLAFVESGLFSIVFANSTGVYACIYVILILSNFPRAHALSVQVGFVLPLLCFAAGVLGHRRQIQHVLDRTRKHAASPLHGTIRWMGPLLIIAVLSTYLNIKTWTNDSQDLALISAMAIIGAVAWLASKHITIFLMESGVILQAFLRNAARLSKPAFALLTCYSVITIFFGCVYTIYDQSQDAPSFQVNGVAQKLSFLDGLYLSVSTLTTVGFGDIIAGAPIARLLVSAEVLCGVLLLLFGVEAMLDRGRR
jgi:voltage-gated potassium channel